MSLAGPAEGEFLKDDILLIVSQFKSENPALDVEWLSSAEPSRAIKS